MSDMDQDLFGDANFAKLAMKQFAPVDENFRIFEAGWLGDKPPFKVMEVKGATFRRATRGPRKGVLCVMVKGTVRTAYVTAAEMEAFEKRKSRKK